MEPRLIQHQSQKLILSPQIRQYLKILQLPIAELQQAVEQELTENPMLEDAQSDEQDEREVVNEPNENEAAIGEAELRLGEDFKKLDELDENLRATYEHEDQSLSDTNELQRKRNFQDTLITKEEALSDFLFWQARFLSLSEEEKKILNEIIGNINDDGFLSTPPEEIASTTQNDLALVLKVLAMVQEFDPPGVGAQNLQEALALQLKRKGSSAKLALKIVTDHLPLLERRDWKQLSKILAVDTGEVKKAAETIGRLEPRPGRIFYAHDSIAVTPDASVLFDDEDPDKLNIEIHDESVPSLRLNSYYRRLLREAATDKKTKAFLREKLQGALNFMRALKLRKSTLRNITEQIVKEQPEFFEKGFSHLKPLRLKDIADALGIHESTVSRALQSKYVTTPRGMIPYKSFFSTRMESSNGQDESQKSIMQKIRHLVDNENAAKPLSDQDIVATLKSDGIKIARRTVAKYRDLLRILPSHLRRTR